MPEAVTQAQSLDAQATAVRVARIAGLGHYVPERVVPNAELAERIGVDDEWIVRRTGIHSRRWAGPEESLDDMAVAAAERALEDAGLRAAEIDLVLVATVSQDLVIPNSAPVVAKRLGTAGAGAIDVGAACTGLLSALQLACGQVEAGRAERVLVIGADLLSRLPRPRRPEDRGAVRRRRRRGRGLRGGHRLGRRPDRARGRRRARRRDLRHPRRLEDPHGRPRDLQARRHAAHRDHGARVRARGRGARRHRPVRLPPGQRAHHPRRRPAARPARGARRRLHRRHGNTSAASIPLALSLLRQDDRLRPGPRVLVAAFGAGFMWGAGLLEWGNG